MNFQIRLLWFFVYRHFSGLKIQKRPVLPECLMSSADVCWNRISPFTRFVKRKFSPSSNDDDFLEFVSKKDPLQPRFLSANWVGALKQWIPYLERHQPVQFPILVIQGKSDQTVDWRHNLPILQKLFAPAEIQYLPKVRHHVVNELELYRKDVFSRIVNYLSPFSTPQ